MSLFGPKLVYGVSSPWDRPVDLDALAFGELYMRAEKASGGSDLYPRGIHFQGAIEWQCWARFPGAKPHLSEFRPVGKRLGTREGALRSVIEEAMERAAHEAAIAQTQPGG